MHNAPLEEHERQATWGTQELSKRECCLGCCQAQQEQGLHCRAGTSKLGGMRSTTGLD